MTTGQHSKAEVSNRTYTVQDAALLLGVKYDSLYRVIKRCQKSKPIFEKNGLSFAICQTASRLLLIPLDAPPPDIEIIENAAASNAMATLIPWLCPDCADKTKLVKAEFEKN